MGITNGVARRELLLALAGGAAAEGQVVTVARWEAAAQVYGVRIGKERWAVLEPVMERRRAQLEVLRRFRVAEGVEPAGGADD